ncbi:MAG TPA: TonB-dependent receptor [Phenylobacterium sp.]|uniref:TonB-dependent receptor n=1 Tax=Phenylobacterium sp. TaxID=1871053 RepID=UPI002B4855F3|nr:TonB-dependent receptor [Phenylobacterium sp.]HKR90251.1 TonB-dependent receptor [Phenylobacterium sp.]
MDRPIEGRRLQLFVSTACAGVLALGGAASAQTAPDAGTKLQEVVVTAQRRSERLEDVPMTVTALPAETLQKSGVNNTADLARVTPGLTISFYGNNLQPAIRGVTATGGNVGDNPSVALYLDGIYQPQQISALMDLPDVEQIEVLKGPQGTLYGQNATGGAIIINTLAPSFIPTGRFSASYGNYNDVNLRGFVSGPVTDVLAVSLAAAYENRDGFRRNVATGERDSGLDSKLVRGKVLYQPAPWAKLTLTGFYTDRKDSSVYATSPLNNNSIGYALIPAAPRVTDPDQFAAYPGIFNRIKSSGYSGRGEFDLPAGTLNVVASYARNRVTALEDLDTSPVNFGEYRYAKAGAQTFVSEINFASKKFGRVSFLAGALYLRADDSFRPGLFILRTPNLTPAAPLPPTTVLYQVGEVKKDIAAAYAEVNIDVTDKLVFTAGGRFTHERQIADSNSVTDPVVRPYPGNPATWSNFSPRITARYEVAPNQNLYASWTKGFKGGLINTSDFNQAPVNPEIISSYEIGYKGRLADNLTLNISGFYYNYDNLQVVAYVAPNYETQNAASSRGKGVDVDANWAATPELTFSAGVSYLDAHYVKFPNAQGYLPTGFGNDPIILDLSGKPLLRSPKWSGNVRANYQVDIAAGRVGAYASVAYSDTYGLEPTNRIRQGAYATLDAELSFSPAAAPRLRLSAWGKNLTNRSYLAMALVTNFSDAVSYGDPRTFGVRAEYKF